jgi:hypothetical protein
VGNADERLAFARLPTGVRVIGVNAGCTFTFAREVAEELRWAAAPAAGSKFRPRDALTGHQRDLAGHPRAVVTVEVARTSPPRPRLTMRARCQWPFSL